MQGAKVMDERTVVAVGLTASLLIGCGGSAPSGGSGAGEGVSTTDTVAISGFLHASDGTLLPAATACLVDGDGNRTCTQTSAAGAFVVHSPRFQPITLEFSKEGYVPATRPISTQAADIALPEGENALLPVASPQTFLGTTMGAATGHIEFFVTAPASETPPSLTVTLTGSGGSTQPTIYLGPDGAPAPAATGGTSGGFANLAPDLYVLRFSGAAGKCTTDGLHGYPMQYADGVDGDRVLLVPVIAGAVTAPVGVNCTP
jgi:hypothetical protein